MQLFITKKIKYTLLLIIFSTITFSLEATEWTGKWISTFGEFSITSTQTTNVSADMGDYILSGSITRTQLAKNDTFSGTYTLKPRLNKPFNQVENYRTLGSSGKFTFKLTATKQEFKGTATPNSTNRATTWDGDKIIILDTSQTTQIPQIPNAANIPKNTATEPVLWTGTWKTNNLGQIKIKWYSEDHIEAKVYIKHGDLLIYADLKGGKRISMTGFHTKYNFVGPYQDTQGRKGTFYFTIYPTLDPDLNSFQGQVQISDKRHLNGQESNISPYNIPVKATRISSSEPNMNNYN